MLFTLIMASIALAETPEQSGSPNVPAEARYAIGQAQGASAKVTALEKRVETLEKAKRKTVKVGGDIKVIEAAIVQANDELKAAVKADAERAEEAARMAETARGTAEDAATRAEASAKRAEDAATRVEASASVPAPMPYSLAPNSLDSAPAPDRDKPGAVFYGAVGISNGWLGRQESYVSNGAGIYTLETSELMSNMLGGSLELGVGGLDDKGRTSISVRGEGMYNLGGGFAGFGEVVVGGFLEKTHSLRLEGFVGVSWEMIPNNAAVGDYSDRRWDLGLAVEVMPVEHFGIWLGGRFLPDNSIDMAGSNAGQAEIALRAKF